MSKRKPNFTHFVLGKTGGAALTVEKTLTPTSYMPTISLDCREPNTNNEAGFNNLTKWTLQLNALTEVPKLLAVLLTYLPEAKFQYHGVKKNHALSVEWVRSKGTLKFTFLFEGKNRFIELPREKVFELAVFVADSTIKTLESCGAASEGTSTLSDINTFIGRCYRPFKST